MSRKMHNLTKRKLPAPRKEEAEFGRPGAGIVACKRCNAWYHGKKWHHDLKVAPGRKWPPHIRYHWCPACTMADRKAYEGKLIVDNVPEDSLLPLMALIEAYGRRAYKRDSQHRVLDIARKEGQLVVTTSENQLAARLGKKIKDAFKTVDTYIFHAKMPSDVTIVKVFFRSHSPSSP